MENVVVVRKGESKKTINLGAGPIRLLAKSEKLEGMTVEIEPGKGVPKVYSHEGEEIRIVLEGEIEVEVADKKYLLKEGDVMWQKSRLPHRIRNPGKKKAVYFSVDIPPSLEW